MSFPDRLIGYSADPVFRHLDEEVYDIGGESLRSAGWTLKDLRQIPM